MPFSTVEIGVARIKTTVAIKGCDIDRIIKTFLSNNNNKKKIIGLDTERSRNETVLLQLCDGDRCLLIQLPFVYVDEDDYDDIPLSLNPIKKDIPLSLFNFLNLPEFTFVGIGINKTLKNLEKEFRLTCKNAVDIGPSTWKNLDDKSSDEKFLISNFVSAQKPISPAFEDWNKFILNKNQIKLAASNAYFAFCLGNVLLNGL